MPSLRRTVSSPAVRSSPYPALSSSGQVNSGPATRAGYNNRRSSGSETANRRVLADIDWWRVTDGQCDLGPEQEDEHASPRSAENVIDSLEGLVSPVWPGFAEDIPELLSIIPHTPPRRGHRLESSTSSVESTPEPVDRTVEDLRLGMQYVDLNASEGAVPPVHSAGQASASPSLPRSHSFADATAVFRDEIPEFADVPLSSQSPFLLN
ncbi:hypothetical protein F5880DRAFT_1610064 [Lentinula raphanica]|nr:hypothetical protein F5880DRAFT_1610064 [Lentinula raphanica]